MSTAAKRAPSNEKPVGEWNICEMVCAGNSVKACINGRLMNEATECNISSGKIGFQSEGGEFEIRKVFLEPVKVHSGVPSQDLKMRRVEACHSFALSRPPAKTNHKPMLQAACRPAYKPVAKRANRRSRSHRRFGVVVSGGHVPSRTRENRLGGASGDALCRFVTGRCQGWDDLCRRMERGTFCLPT